MSLETLTLKTTIAQSVTAEIVYVPHAMKNFHTGNGYRISTIAKNAAHVLEEN